MRIRSDKTEVGYGKVSMMLVLVFGSIAASYGVYTMKRIRKA